MKLTSIGSFAVICLLSRTLGNATTIDFEAQGSAAPSAFNNKLNSPLTIGITTFTGGELLKNETFGAPGADTTVVYATNGFGTGYTDPLVITFAQAVSNVSLLVTNETPDTYTLSDDLGNLVTLSVGNNVSQTLSLSDAGAMQITIRTVSPVGWDYAIDNVSFAAAAVAPEPLTTAPVAASLLAFLLVLKKQRRKFDEVGI